MYDAGDVNKIINHVISGNGRHATFERLAVFGDRFGPRMTGSESLEKAIS